MSGISSALKKVFGQAMKSTKFKKIFTPTAQGGAGGRAYEDNDIRIDRGVLPGQRVLQIQSQTTQSALKKFAQKHSTHAKVAEVTVPEGTNAATAENAQKFVQDALEDVKAKWG